MRSIKEVLHDIHLDISSAEIDSNLLLSRLERDNSIKNREEINEHMKRIVDKIDRVEDLLKELQYKIDCID